MTEFFELLKYTIPGLVVFATAYYILKSYMDHHYQTLIMTKKLETQKITLPVRLQAYERLVLLCDRLAIPNLLLRVRSGEMTVTELKAALMIAISQEFDHNTSQQLYVSETLWQIISLAKADSLTMVAKASEGLDGNAPDNQLVNQLFSILSQMGEVTMLQKAQNAIRTEAGQLF